MYRELMTVGLIREAKGYPVACSGVLHYIDMSKEEQDNLNVICSLKSQPKKEFFLKDVAKDFGPINEQYARD
jgi:hypothetical protein